VDTRNDNLYFTNTSGSEKKTNNMIRIKENNLVYISILCLDAKILQQTSTLHEIRSEFNPLFPTINEKALRGDANSALAVV